MKLLTGPIIYIYAGLNIKMGHVGKDTFPLPTLSKELRGLAQELYSGRGFFVLRTIPIDQYSAADLAIIYAGAYRLTSVA